MFQRRYDGAIFCPPLSLPAVCFLALSSLLFPLFVSQKLRGHALALSCVPYVLGALLWLDSTARDLNPFECWSLLVVLVLACRVGPCLLLKSSAPTIPYPFLRVVIHYASLLSRGDFLIKTWCAAGRAFEYLPQVLTSAHKYPPPKLRSFACSRPHHNESIYLYCSLCRMTSSAPAAVPTDIRLIFSEVNGSLNHAPKLPTISWFVSAVVFSSMYKSAHFRTNYYYRIQSLQGVELY